MRTGPDPSELAANPAIGGTYFPTKPIVHSQPWQGYGFIELAQKGVVPQDRTPRRVHGGTVDTKQFGLPFCADLY